MLLVLISTATRAARAQQQQAEDPPPPPASPAAAAPTTAADDDADGAAAVLSTMAARAQQNSLSQTLIALMALASAELQDGSNITNSSSTFVPPQAPDLVNAMALLPKASSSPLVADANASASATATPANGDLRAALRAHLEELVGQQQQHFVNALGFAHGSDAATPTTATTPKNNDDDIQRRIAGLFASLAERAAAEGPASIKLHDGLVLGLGRTVRAATTQQPGAGPCGQYEWDAGGEYTPASWEGPAVSLSLSLGSCALVPSLEGPGAALTAGSAWTNAVGELACLGPGIAYSLSPLTYVSAGITGESLSAPACRIAAAFGPALSLRLTRSPKGGGGSSGQGGGDVYASEGEFLAGAVLNGTLDKRIRRLQRALEGAAGIKKALSSRRGKEAEGGGWFKGETEEAEGGGGGDYELAWEVEKEAGGDGLQGNKEKAKRLLKGAPFAPLLRALLQLEGHGGDGKAERGAPAAAAFDNRVVG